MSIVDKIVAITDHAPDRPAPATPRSKIKKKRRKG